MLLSIFIFILVGYSVAATPPYYIIPNAETPSLGRPGLTPIGKNRAEVCIPAIFSKLDIGQIISCKIKGHECAEANQTALPLATLLGLNITTCNTDTNSDCVTNKLLKFNKKSNQSTLIVWAASDVDNLIQDVDLDDTDVDASLLLRPDVILTATENSSSDLVKRGSKSTVVLASMNCTGIDVPASP